MILAATLLTACSSSSSSQRAETSTGDGGPSTVSEGGPSTIGDGGPDGSTQESGADGSADAMVPMEASGPPAFLTNTPSVMFENDTETDSGTVAADLVLLSSHLTESPSGSAGYYQEWFGELENVSASTTYCYPRIQITLSPGPGMPLVLQSYADTMPAYQSAGSKLSDPCLAPGEHGAFWSNHISSTSANVASSTTFQYQLAADIFPMDHVSAAEPMIVDSVQPWSSVTGDVDVEGTLTAVADISNVGFVSFLRDTTGLIVAHVSATDLNSVAAGTTWMFQTNPALGPFASHFDTISFITAAPAPAAQEVVRPLSYVQVRPTEADASRLSTLQADRASLVVARAARASAVAGR